MVHFPIGFVHRHESSLSYTCTALKILFPKAAHLQKREQQQQGQKVIPERSRSLHTLKLEAIKRRTEKSDVKKREFKGKLCLGLGTSSCTKKCITFPFPLLLSFELLLLLLDSRATNQLDSSKVAA